MFGENLHIQSGDGVILAGPADGWTLVIQVEGHNVVLDESLVRLSENGHRVLGLSWDIGGNEEIGYAVDGEMLVRFSFTLPDLRSGTDVTVLERWPKGGHHHQVALPAAGHRVIVGFGRAGAGDGDGVQGRASAACCSAMRRLASAHGIGS